MLDSQQSDDVVEGKGLVGLSSELQILANGQMGKQPGILEHVTQSALFGRKVYSGVAVEQHLSPNLDATAIGFGQSRHHLHQRGLARARGAEQGGHAGMGGDGHIQGELAQAFVKIELKHVWSSIWTELPSRSGRQRPAALKSHTGGRRHPRRRGFGSRYKAPAAGSGFRRECWRQR